MSDPLFKVVQLKADGHLGSVLVPNMLAVDYGTPKKPKKAKTAAAFYREEDARQFMADWAPYRGELQLWTAEADKHAPPPKSVANPHIIAECEGLLLLERLT